MQRLSLKKFPYLYFIDILSPMRRRRRKICGKFKNCYFKPRNIPITELGEVAITHAELEALRLRYIDHLPQIEAAKRMGISQSQYQRDLSLALQKVTDALVNRKALKIENNND